MIYENQAIDFTDGVANTSKACLLPSATGRRFRVSLITVQFANNDAAFVAPTLRLGRTGYPRIWIGAGETPPATTVNISCFRGGGQQPYDAGAPAAGTGINAPLPDLWFDQDMILTLASTGATWQFTGIGVVLDWEPKRRFGRQ